MKYPHSRSRCDELIKLKCSDITINAESMLMWPPVRQISTGRDLSLLWDSDKDLPSENVGKIFCNGWFISYITCLGEYLGPSMGGCLGEYLGPRQARNCLKVKREGLRARKKR